MTTLNGMVALTVASLPLRVSRPGILVVLMSSGLCQMRGAPTDTAPSAFPGRAAPNVASSARAPSAFRALRGRRVSVWTVERGGHSAFQVICASPLHQMSGWRAFHRRHARSLSRKFLQLNAVEGWATPSPPRGALQPRRLGDVDDEMTDGARRVTRPA